MFPPTSKAPRRGGHSLNDAKKRASQSPGGDQAVVIAEALTVFAGKGGGGSEDAKRNYRATLVYTGNEVMATILLMGGLSTSKQMYGCPHTINGYGGDGGKCRAALSKLVEAARANEAEGSTVVVEYEDNFYAISSDWKTLREAGELGGELRAALSKLVEAARKDAPEGSTVVVEHEGKLYAISSDWKTPREGVRDI